MREIYSNPYYKIAQALYGKQQLKTPMLDYCFKKVTVSYYFLNAIKQARKKIGLDYERR